MNSPWFSLRWSQVNRPLRDPVTWYGINYAGTQIRQWDFQNKGTLTSPARLSCFGCPMELDTLKICVYKVPTDLSEVLPKVYQV